MGLEQLSSQEIEGRFWETFEGTDTASWADALTVEKLDSNKEEETYKFTGHAPRMKLWKGERTAEAIRVFEMKIRNQEYEASYEPLVRHLRRDHTGQIFRRIDEMAEAAREHKPTLVSDLMLAGDVDEGYDGVPFYAATHVEGKSGTQSNDITISGIAVPADPTEKEMAKAIYKAIVQLWTLKDDRGNPRNQGARSFMVSVPLTLYRAALGAVTLPFLPGDAGAQNFVALQTRFKIEIEPIPYLSAWTTEFTVSRLDGAVAPFIWQEEVPLQLETIGDGSELEVYQKKHFFGLYAVRGTGYGWWSYSCKATLAA